MRISLLYIYPHRPAEEELLSKSGTLLALYVVNEQNSDILGMSVVHGADIPHLYAHVNSHLSQEDIPERKNLTLNLFTQKESAVRSEVEQRLQASDQEVVRFHKSNRKLFQKSGKKLFAK